MIVALLVACAPPEPYAVPAGATTSLFAFDGPLATFPDDLHTTPDPSTVTGARVSFSDEAWAELDALVPPSFTLRGALESLDGFGTSAGVMLTFSAPIDLTSVTPEGVLLVDLATGAAVPWTASATTSGTTLVITPDEPLQDHARYGLAVTRLRDASGADVAASVDFRALVTGDAPPEISAALTPAYALLASHAGVRPEDLIAGTVFTTQSIYAESAAAADLVSGQPGPVTPLGCVDEGAMRSCEVAVEVADLLGDDGRLDAVELAGRYALPVSVWLPPGEGPWPLVIYAHGLGGDRGEGRGVAQNLVDLGIAVAAVDAPSHGEHPAGGGTEFTSIFEFFGISLVPVGMDVTRLRDGWRRATWDKLQLVEALRAGADVDGDGAPDLDGRVGFAGHSLGATMGPQLLAYDPEIGAAELATPGGRVTEIVHKGEIFAPMVALFAPDDASDDDVDRFFPLLQAAIERGDAVNFGALAREGGRDVLVTEVMADTIIPNVCTEALARALGVHHAPPILAPVVGIEPSAPLPLAGNLDGATALLYQYDVMWDDGALVDATHTHIHGSESGVAQYRQFWATWAAGQAPEVIDPLAP
jgi:dienelactone hydrolase